MSSGTILITGASSDIGQSVAKELSIHGFNIAAHYYKNLEAVQAIKKQGEKNDIQVELFCHDLSQSHQAEEMVNAVVDKFGSIDVLINTIGPFYYKDIFEVTPNEWLESINMNLCTAFNVTYFAKKYICEAKGHIINFGFSGVENLKAWEMSTGYCAAKAGIVVLTKSLAKRLAPLGVRVNAICPGLIEVDTSTEEERQEMAKQIPLGRPGRPSEIAEVVKWIVNESPAYLTGALIPVCGAWEY